MLATAPARDRLRIVAKDFMNPQTPAGGDHFTPIDRERIITTSVDLKNLREDFLDLKKSLYDGDNRFTTMVSTQGNRFESLLNAQANRFEGLLNAQANRFEGLVNANQAKFEALVTKVEGKLDAQAKDHGERLGKLETYKYWLMGAAAGSGSLAGLLGSRFFHP